MSVMFPRIYRAVLGPIAGPITGPATGLVLAVAGVVTGSGAMAQDLASGTGFTITIAGPDDGFRPSAPAALAAPRPEVDISFDGLAVEPLLELRVLTPGPVRAGQPVEVASGLNYPAFTTRGEVRVVDLDAGNGTGVGSRTLAVVPLGANGRTVLRLPEGRNLALVYRVYDSRGRYDETAPLPVGAGPGEPGVGEIAEAEIEDTAAGRSRSRIPVFGAGVTLRGTNVTEGASVLALGESFTAGSSGRFTVQRILPPGEQPVAVSVTGPGPDLYVEEIITVPNSDWFYTATVDLTFGRRFNDPVSSSGEPLPETYNSGRIAGYANGRTANGWSITASVDTGETELDALFDDLDGKDTTDTLLRALREESYPTFGDDSTITDGAPTDGKIYVHVERDGSALTWGRYQATVAGSEYLRNERALYGLHGVYRSPDTTSHGENRASIEVYAASPDRLPAREAFLGTGGSVYFLQRQDITTGSETLTIELRDADTGRVIDRQTLQEGRDYRVNYLQGVITLAEPLNSSVGTSGVVSDPTRNVDAFLVANYEFTPIGTELDGLSYGARAEGWVTDDLRIGVTGIVEQTDVADQTAVGADLRYRLGDNSYVALDYAETTGPGFGSSVSSTGGLIITSNDTAGTDGGTGTAYNAEVFIDFEELGSDRPGSFAAYVERRTAGFSTLDYETTVDEDLWGVALSFEPTDQLGVTVTYDDFADADGKEVRAGDISVRYALNAASSLAVGVAHLDKTTPGGAADETGRRTDLALRYTREASDDLSWYVFGQGTVDRSGGLEENNRVGLGVAYALNRNWTVEAELSDGTLGTAAEVLITRKSGEFDQTYLGYRLEPGRALSGVTLDGDDRGTWVAGVQRRLGARTDMFAETTYDIYGRHRSRSNAVGVQFRATEFATYSLGYETGQIDDGADDDFDRHALSIGMRYNDPDRLVATAKLEYRLDDGTIGGSDRGQEALFLVAAARYIINEERRLLVNLDYAQTETDDSSIQSGTYAQAAIGYAFRPVLDEKLNLLFQYRYLKDMIGQEIDGTETLGPRQESHVVSVDLSYDLGPRWTLGAKVGGRFSESSPSEGVDFARNDAWLGVINARYNLTGKWDVLLEGRYLEADQAALTETGILAAVYRQVGQNLKVGVGYNFGSFSDDLTDLTLDDEGAFLNIVAKF